MGTRTSPRSLRLTLAMVACACTVVNARAASPELMPVALYQAGPKAIQVEISAGRVGPCDSGSNVRLFKGWVDPGASIRAMSPYGCVCFRQTYDDFPGVNWSPSIVTCRRSCAVLGGFGRCPADPSDSISISIKSSPR